MYLKFIKLHVNKLAIGGELRNLTFFRDSVKNAKSPKKSQTWGGGWANQAYNLNYVSNLDK